MPGLRRLFWTSASALLACLPVAAQAPLPAPASEKAPAVAATVNGQPVPESVVQRGLDAVPAAKRADIRRERLNALIDDLLIDQYLQQLMIVVDPAEVDKRIKEMREEMTKRKQDFDKMLKEMNVTETELKQHTTAELRWEKFVDGRATDKVLAEVFETNKEAFDGTTVHARHILITPESGEAKSVEDAQAKLAAIKKTIDAEVAAGMAKVKPDADALTREKARAGLTDEVFAAAAKAESACPSKKNGGDVGWFQRAGFMVEPFAKAAFALKPYQISDVVRTPFGYHLILAVERKPGRDVKFDDVKDMVKEYYGATLREAIAAQVRPKSKIEIYPAPTVSGTPLPAPK